MNEPAKPVKLDDLLSARDGKFRRAVRWGFDRGLLSVRRSALDVQDTTKEKKPGRVSDPGDRQVSVVAKDTISDL